MGTAFAEPSTVSLIATGLHFHQQGDLASAEQNYACVLAREPQQADALHLLGLLRGRSDPAAGVRLVERAIANNPSISAYHNNLGNLLLRMDDVAAAEASYRRAVALDARNADAFLNLGKLLSTASRHEEARQSFASALALTPTHEAHYLAALACKALELWAEAEQHLRHAIAIRPDSADAHFNLGNVHRSCSRFSEAVDSYQRAIELDPAHAADACNNLGITLSELGRDQEAVAAFLKAVTLNPAPEFYTLACLGLGRIHRAHGRLEDAAEIYRAAIAFDPRAGADVWNNLGVVLLEMEQPEAAEQAFRKTLALKPDCAQAWCNLGILKENLGFLAKAAEFYRNAIQLDKLCLEARANLGGVLSHMGDPEGILLLQELAREQPQSAYAQWSSSLALLLAGRYQEGWNGYDWRLEIEDVRASIPVFAQPRWGGEPLEGRTILLLAEGGFGDTLHFMRYAPLVAARGGTVILAVQPELKRFLQGLPGVAACVSHEVSALPPFDLHSSLLSLPRLFDTSVVTIPPPVLPQHLSTAREPDAEPGPGQRALRVGLVWAGNPKHKRDRHRSIPLRQFHPLAAIKGVEFTSLTVGAGAAQLAEDGACFGFVETCAHVRDFADTAAIVRELDLVITVDSSVAHLAATLGKPVWMLLYIAREWRWGLSGHTTPWYPSMTLFRQTIPGDWRHVMDQVGRQLEVLARSRS